MAFEMLKYSLMKYHTEFMLSFFKGLILTALLIFHSESTFGQDLNRGDKRLTGQVKSVGETLNFELFGQNSWDYDVKRVKEKGTTKLLLSVKGLNSDAISRIKNTDNPFVSQIKVSEQKVDGRNQIEFTLKSDKVEAFDYLTDSPSKLIIDFYFDEPSFAVADSGSSSRKAIKAGTPKVNEAKKKDSKTVAQNTGSKKRTPANDFLSVSDFTNNPNHTSEEVDLKSGLFDQSENKFARFQIKAHELNPDAVYKSSLSDYYVKFPIIEQPFLFWTKIQKNVPDFEITPKKTDENKQARLIRSLYEKKKTLVLIKTVDWFSKKYPDSEYLELANAMVAESLLQMWKETGDKKYLSQSQAYYQKVMEKYPNSPLAERSSLANAMYDFDNKNYLAAMRKLTLHRQNPKYVDSISASYAQMAEAACLAKLNKLEDALKNIDEVIATAKETSLKAEAEIYKANYLMLNNKYAEAKNQYADVVKNYSKESELLPVALFNKMEATFRLRQNLEAHQAALDFLQKYSSHEYAPYALTRVGEVLETVGAPAEKYVGAYLETQFRYGENPKTVVARLHLLSVRMKGMKEEELKVTLAKMDELTQKSNLPEIAQFKAMMVADGYSRRSQYEKAIETLTKFYQDQPTQANSTGNSIVSDQIKQNIFNLIRSESEKGNHKNVLSLNKKYVDSWIRNEKRIDNTYYIGKAYQSAGAYQQAIKNFETVINSMNKLGQDYQSKVIKAKENLPQLEQAYLAIASSQNQMNNFQGALENIEKIKNPSVLTPAEQIERVDIASQLYERKNDFPAAIRYLNEVVRVWQDQPDLVANSAVRLAQLEAKNKNYDQALNVLDQLLEKEMKDDSKMKLYKAKAEIALNGKRDDEAVDSLKYILEKGSGKNQAEERFKLGELLYKKGELKNAKEVWTNFSAQDDTFWKKMADERMSGYEWQADYKKYLNRIPASVREQK